MKECCEFLVGFALLRFDESVIDASVFFFEGGVLLRMYTALRFERAVQELYTTCNSSRGLVRVVERCHERLETEAMLSSFDV